MYGKESEAEGTGKNFCQMGTSLCRAWLSDPVRSICSCILSNDSVRKMIPRTAWDFEFIRYGELFTLIPDRISAAWDLLMFHMQIFFPGSKSAANMTLLLVDIQNFPGFQSEGRVDLAETLSDILMHGRLADPEFLCCLPDSRFCYNNIICDPEYTFFYVIFQGKPPKWLFLQCMRRQVTICGLHGVG